MLWRPQRGPGGETLVFGYVGADEVHAVRVRCESPGEVMLDGAAVLPTLGGRDLPARLREKLPWSAPHALAFAGSTPALYGHAVTVELSQWDEAGAGVRDAREILHLARWQALDTTRDKAAAYFGVPLEDIEPVGSSLERWRQTSEETTATVFQACLPRWARDERVLPDDVGGNRFLLPLVLAHRVGNGDPAEALLCMEDQQMSVSIRKHGVLREVRTVRCGARDVRRELARVLECAETDAEILLQKLSSNGLADMSERLLARVLRRLAPLWSGALHVLFDDLAPDVRPVRMQIVGMYPRIVGKWLCRPRLVADVLGFPCRCSVLRLVDGDSLGWTSTLLLTAEAFVQSTAPGSRLGVQVPQQLVRA